MKVCDVREIVEDNIKSIRWAMGFQSWDVMTYYETIDKGDAVGECRIDAGRHRIRITIDPNGFDDEREVLTTLIHEFCHALMGRFEVYRAQARQYVDSDSAWSALDESFKDCHEDAVARIMGMMDTMKLDPVKFARTAKRLYLGAKQSWSGKKRKKR